MRFPLGPPEGHYPVFQDDQGPNGRNEGVDGRLVTQGPEDRPFHHQTHKGHEGGGSEKSTPETEVVAADQEVADVGPQHVQVAVGEVGDVQDAENQRQPQGHDGIGASQHDAVEDLLEEEIHA